MSSLLLLTDALAPTAEVLPALGLLQHQVRIMPADGAALLDAPRVDALLVDGRRDLPRVRSLCRVIRSTGADVPVLLIVTEGGLAAITFEWGVDDVLLDSAGPSRSRGPPAPVDRSAARCLNGGAVEEIRSGELVIDEATYTARLRKRVLDLTFKEFELLKYLAQHPGACSQERSSCRRFGATTTSAERARLTFTCAGCERSSEPNMRPRLAQLECWLPVCGSSS